MFSSCVCACGFSIDFRKSSICDKSSRVFGARDKGVSQLICCGSRRGGATTRYFGRFICGVFVFFFGRGELIIYVYLYKFLFDILILVNNYLI